MYAVGIGMVIGLGAISMLADSSDNSSGKQENPYQPKSLERIKKNKEDYKKFEKYISILEGSGGSKEFNKEISLIKNKKEKKEVIEYFEKNYKLDLSGKNSKKKMTATEEEEWNKLSNEEKLNDTLGRVPFAMFITVLEFTLVFGSAIFAL